MSLYLGSIGTKKNEYEIVAFTNGRSFRFFSAEEIGDKELFSKMLSERFKSLKMGRNIYCTAVSPDVEKGIEQNPHDDREGTVHVAALDKNTGRMSCFLSIAVDTGEKDGSDIIGLPLENRWRQNGYPKGDLLDNFREKYSVLNRGENRPVRPYEMAELYRHLRVNGDPGEQISRLGIYVGLYHLLVREPRNRGEVETSIWVFDAIPKYFHLYRLAGAAVLRDPVIEDYPRHISPNVDEIQKTVEDKLLYKDEIISRDVETLKALPGILGDLSFIKESVPFMDGVIDIAKMEEAVIKDPLGLSKLRHSGMTDQDMSILQIAVSIFGKRHYADQYAGDKETLSAIEGRREFFAPVWNYNGVGM